MILGGICVQNEYYYEVKTPQDYDENKKYPLLIAFHGIGHHEEFAWINFDGVTDEFIVISVRGDLEFKNGYAYYLLEGFGKPDMDTFDDCMKMMPAFVSGIIDEYPVDKNNVYLGGFSQGAILSNTLALKMGDTISGIVSMNGYVPEFLEERYGVKSVEHLDVFLSDGKEDEIFPPEIGKKNEAFFKDQGANVSYTTYDTAHQIGEQNKKDIAGWLLDQV